MAIRFLSEFDPQYGRCVEVAPGIRRVVARNPSKYTAWGTGTYVVGRGDVAVIDPGPADESHLEALLGTLAGETVTHILITHTHGDHSPGSALLRERTGARTYGFGPHPLDADTEGEEHGDRDFVPDVRVGSGDVIEGADFTFECVHTPGHISNHLCFAERRRRVMFTGDHVMGWSTSVISPPDGDMADYLASLRLLLDRDEEVLYPTHGPPIEDPVAYVGSLIEHRLAREAQIVGQLESGPLPIEAIVEVLYADVAAELHKPAARSVESHLIKLASEGRVRRVGGDDPSTWELRRGAQNPTD